MQNPVLHTHPNNQKKDVEVFLNYLDEISQDEPTLALICPFFLFLEGIHTTDLEMISKINAESVVMVMGTTEFIAQMIAMTTNVVLIFTWRKPTGKLTQCDYCLETSRTAAYSGVQSQHFRKFSNHACIQ